MKLALGGGGSGDKQNPALMVVLVVVILAAVFFVGRNFIGGGGSAELPAPGTAPTPGPVAPGEGPMAPVPMPPGPGVGPEGTPSPGGTEGSPAPPSQPPAGSQGAGAAAPGAAAPTSDAASRPPTRPVKVFRTVTVEVPEGWGVDIAAAKSAAVFTNGKAYFEIHAPDPRAKTAKEIADSAVRTLGGKVSGQSADRIAGHEAYIYSLTKGGSTTRVVGLDAPTRVVLVAYVRGGSFSDYRHVFDQMQSSLKFSAQ